MSRSFFFTARSGLGAWSGSGFVAVLLAASACAEPATSSSDGNGSESSSTSGDSFSGTEAGGPTTLPPPVDTGETSVDEVSDDGNFIEVPDGGIAAQCDLFGQDCPKGQKCTSYVSTPGGAVVDASHCVEVIGDDQWGEACERMSGNDTCAAGFFCMTDVSGNTGEGSCFEYCQVGTPCEFGGQCFPFNNGQLPLCEVLCNPLAASTCGPGQGCYRAFDQFVCARPGFPEGGGSDGDTCATIQGCQPGLICSGITSDCSGTACCTPICEIGLEQCTDVTEECLIAIDPPPPGLELVGECGVPE